MVFEVAIGFLPSVSGNLYGCIGCFFRFVTQLVGLWLRIQALMVSAYLLHYFLSVVLPHDSIQSIQGNYTQS